MEILDSPPGGEAMETLNVLNDLRIASPCPATWDAMQGDERVRFCDSCSKHVYNISNLTAQAAVSLIRESEGRLCVRLYRRKDGTVLTADCPVGLRSAVRRRLIRLLTAGVVVCAMVRSGIAMVEGLGPRVSIPPAPTGPGVTFTDWAEWAAVALGIKQPSFGPVDVGDLRPPAPPSGTAPSGGGAETGTPAAL
jgi:hypothetical protein